MEIALPTPMRLPPEHSFLPLIGRIDISNILQILQENPTGFIIRDSEEDEDEDFIPARCCFHFSFQRYHPPFLEAAGEVLKVEHISSMALPPPPFPALLPPTLDNAAPITAGPTLGVDGHNQVESGSSYGYASRAPEVTRYRVVISLEAQTR